MYADDTTIYASASSHDKVAEKLNHILERLYEWCCKNQMTPHPKKTEYMLLTRRRYIIGPLQQISLGGCSVKLVTSSRCLGVQLDHELKWDNHLRWLKAVSLFF